MSKHSIRIPERHIEAFEVLLNLPDEVLTQIVSVIDNAPLGTSESNLYEMLVDQVVNLSKDNIRNLYSIYVNLSIAKNELNISEEEFISELESALRDTKIESIVPNENGLNILRKFFKKHTNVELTRKIENDQVQNENNFKSIKVLTDIRSVFDAGEFIGSTILNRLRISYYNEGNLKDIYLTVDESDVTLIIESLQSAQRNNKILKEKYVDLQIIDIVN